MFAGALDITGWEYRIGENDIQASTIGFTGLAAARYSVLERVGWDVNERGLIGAPPVHVAAGAGQRLGGASGRPRPAGRRARRAW